jgi:citrate synthase
MSSAAAATAALFGPLHGGANEQVLKMLDEIGSWTTFRPSSRASRTGKRLLMGFGHRIYKNYDPRARIIKQTADAGLPGHRAQSQAGHRLELERIALSDEYFISRKLYPNVDFYSGIIYQALGFQPEIFTVLFAIPRMTGWCAQWDEMLATRAEDRPAAADLSGFFRKSAKGGGSTIFAPGCSGSPTTWPLT